MHWYCRSNCLYVFIYCIVHHSQAALQGGLMQQWGWKNDQRIRKTANTINQTNSDPLMVIIITQT